MCNRAETDFDIRLIIDIQAIERFLLLSSCIMIVLFQYDDPMGHYSGMSDINGSTSGSSGIYGGDLNRSMPPVSHLNHGPPLTHFSSDTQSRPIHNTQSAGGSVGDDRMSEADQIVLKRDKDSIYT